jgi:hypothetical protein
VCELNTKKTSVLLPRAHASGNLIGVNFIHTDIFHTPRVFATIYAIYLRCFWMTFGGVSFRGELGGVR